MSNSVIITNDITQDATISVVTGGTAAGFNITDIANDKKSFVWRSTLTTGISLSILWSTDQVLSGVGLALTNLVKNDQFRIRLLNSTPTEIYNSGLITVPYNYPPPQGFNTNNSLSFGFGGGTYASHNFAEVSSVRELRVEFEASGNPDGFVELCKVFAGDALILNQNPDYGVLWDTQNDTEIIRVKSGSSLVDRSWQHKQLSFNWTNIGKADKAALTDIIKKVGNHSPFYISLFPQETDETWQAGQLYGRLIANPIAHNLFNVFDLGFEMDEF